MKTKILISAFFLITLIVLLVTTHEQSDGWFTTGFPCGEETGLWSETKLIFHEFLGGAFECRDYVIKSPFFGEYKEWTTYKFDCVITLMDTIEDLRVEEKSQCP